MLKQNKEKLGVINDRKKSVHPHKKTHFLHVNEISSHSFNPHWSTVRYRLIQIQNTITKNRFCNSWAGAGFETKLCQTPAIHSVVERRFQVGLVRDRCPLLCNQMGVGFTNWGGNPDDAAVLAANSLEGGAVCSPPIDKERPPPPPIAPPSLLLGNCIRSWYEVWGLTSNKYSSNSIINST